MAANQHGLKVLDRRYSAKRNRLYRESPYCFWCGRFTVLQLDPPNRRDLATVDHLYSRLHPERDANKTRYVLACRVCNQQRGALEARGKPFVPFLSERKQIALETSAHLTVKTRGSHPLWVREKMCGNRPFNSATEACLHRDEMQRLLRRRLIFFQCERCGKWHVDTMTLTAKQRRKRLCKQIARIESTTASDFIEQRASSTIPWT